MCRRWCSSGRCGCGRDGLGRGNARDFGSQAEFLEAESVDLAGRLEAVSRLEFLHGRSRVQIPFAVGLALVIAATSERGLNLLDAVRRGCFLSGLAASTALL